MFQIVYCCLDIQRKKKGEGFYMITERELLEELKISRTTLWRLKKMGMPYIKVGSAYRYDKEEVIQWFKSNKISSFDKIGYKEIEIDYSSSSEALEAISILSEKIKKEDMFAEITGKNTVTVYLRQVDMNKLKSIESNNAVIKKIINAIESIKSYGVRGGKRIFIDYDKEKKVTNRKQKEQARGKYFYAQGHEYTKQNNQLPDEFVNQIICGDSEEVLKKLPDNCIDLIFTSPPYNFGLEYDSQNDGYVWDDYFNKLFKIFDECIRVLKYGGRIIVNIQPLFSDYIPTHHIISNFFMERKLIWKGEIIWEKNNYNCKYTAWGSWKSPSNPYLKYTWEFLEIFSKGSLKKEGDKNNIDISADEFKEWVVAKWAIAPEKDMAKYGHPAMFPEELARRVIKLFSYQNDVVLDPFNGVGTTTAVAKKLNRKFVGIDISKEYCEKALKRINQITLPYF
jgi:DNA modification methylase/predicted DNA-binding transcriptional regulator AlpA